MRFLLYFLLFSFSISYAQEISFKRDSILSTKDSVFFSVQNNVPSPIYLITQKKKNTPKTIAYNRGTFIEANKKVNGVFRVPKNFIPHPESDLFNLTKYFSFTAGYGNPNTVKPNKKYKYLFPFKKFKKLIQGNFGRFTHSDHVAHYYAFDFGTKIGDTIYAAREGKVIRTKEDSKQYGNTKAALNMANYITILHDDGTTASYVHLHFNGVLVKKDDIVTRGQAIGISGMTGFTTIPHLHFVVHMPTKKYGNVSIPIEFEGYIGKKLKKGYSYSRLE
ncbi:M23 family metallopeptidase [uncultured Kordia sp.]|uniref:M23 family metallopeptidase n=1 Tax=uncultured Kordia sp. TaxID=507699 RepID=UPI0026379BF2|nr:M23 family metallopeptidase [uncultured Kordia sp.]